MDTQDKLKTIINELLDWLEDEHMGLREEVMEYINNKYDFDLNDFLIK